MPTIKEKIDTFARRIQLKDDWGAHSTIKQELLALCREYAMSCKPDKKHNTSTYPEARYLGEIEGYNTALKEWEENINKPV